MYNCTGKGKKNLECLYLDMFTIWSQHKNYKRHREKSFGIFFLHLCISSFKERFQVIRTHPSNEKENNLYGSQNIGYVGQTGLNKTFKHTSWLCSCRKMVHKF